MKPWLREPVPNGNWLLTCFIVGLLFCANVWLYSRLQVARVDAIERLCLRDNVHADQNIEFVRAVSPRVTAQAVGTFKKEPDCHAFALRTAHSPPPQP